jgi:hypothetical protein
MALVVEPLVDSISELVVSAVTGDFSNVSKTCGDIAIRTNKLVINAQSMAASSNNVELQIAVANAINDVAEGVDKLVTRFNTIITNNSGRAQEEFAAAAKEIGEAINKLCSATDETSEAKIMNAVKLCIASAKKVNFYSDAR